MHKLPSHLPVDRSLLLKTSHSRERRIDGEIFLNLVQQVRLTIPRPVIPEGNAYGGVLTAYTVNVVTTASDSS